MKTSRLVIVAAVLVFAWFASAPRQAAAAK
jgi:hypothetical protein